MAFSGISIPSSHHLHPNFLIVRNLATIPSTPKPQKPSSPLPSSPLSTPSSSSDAHRSEILPFSVGRRMLSLSIVGLLEQPLSRFLFFSKAQASQLLELDRYTDPKEGFTLLVPSSWIKVPILFLPHHRLHFSHTHTHTVRLGSGSCLHSEQGTVF